MFDFARSESLLRCLSPFPTIASNWIRRAWRAKLTPAAVLAAILSLLAAGAHAQTIYTVTLVTDAQSTDSSGNPGLGPGAPGDLRYGIQQAIANGGTQIIQFSTSICNNSEPCKITLSNPLPPIENNGGLNLTIDGGIFGWVIIDGASSYRVFFVDAGTVTLRNLQIQNALAQGGAGGGGGGGGGMGAGAGLFVNQSGAFVSVQNSYFLNSATQGGNGASGSGTTGGGGGGMAYGGGSGLFGAGGGGGGGILGGGGGVIAYSGGVSGNGGGGGGGSGACGYGVGGGAAYGTNSPGSAAPFCSNYGGNGGFGGGGGGGGTATSAALVGMAASAAVVGLAASAAVQKPIPGMAASAAAAAAGGTAAAAGLAAAAARMAGMAATATAGILMPVAAGILVAAAAAARPSGQQSLSTRAASTSSIAAHPAPRRLPGRGSGYSVLGAQPGGTWTPPFQPPSITTKARSTVRRREALDSVST